MLVDLLRQKTLEEPTLFMDLSKHSESCDELQKHLNLLLSNNSNILFLCAACNNHQLVQHYDKILPQSFSLHAEMICHSFVLEIYATIKSKNKVTAIITFTATQTMVMQFQCTCLKNHVIGNCETSILVSQVLNTRQTCKNIQT